MSAKSQRGSTRAHPVERLLDTESNLVIEADAVVALEALVSTHAGAVKLCYIDPPFNTGRRFVGYTDRRSLSTWSDLLIGCLEQTRELLARDGSVWLHLDDNHAHHGRVILDEIFGAENYVGTIIWEKKRKPSFLHSQMACVTDQVIIYAKDRFRLGPFTDGLSTPSNPIPLHNRGSKRRVLSFAPQSVHFGCADQDVLAGVHSTPAVKLKLLDDVEILGGTNVEAFRMEGEWRYDQARLDRHLAEGDEIHIAGVPFRPRRQRTTSLSKKITNLWSHRVNACPTNEDGTAELRELGLDKHFGTPKPEGLIARIIEAASEPGDLVLDYFAGSGTTAAVAHRMERHWITVEQNPDTIANCIIPRIEAVIDGRVPRLPSSGATLPAGIRPANLATTQRVLEAAREHGTFDDLDTATVDALLDMLRASPQPEPEWTGGGSFKTVRLRTKDATQPA